MRTITEQKLTFNHTDANGRDGVSAIPAGADAFRLRNKRAERSGEDMFKKRPVDEKHISIIDENCRIEGDLHFEGDLLINGSIEGTLSAESVAIGKGGRFCGKIKTNSLSIEGYFEGEMEVVEVLTLRESADVKARIECRKMVVEKNASVNGSIQCGQPAAVQIASVENSITPLVAQRQAG